MAVKYHVFPMYPAFAFVQVQEGDSPMAPAYTGVSVQYQGPEKPMHYTGPLVLPPYVQEGVRGLFESIQGKSLAEVREINFTIEPPLGGPAPQ